MRGHSQSAPLSAQGQCFPWPLFGPVTVADSHRRGKNLLVADLPAQFSLARHIWHISPSRSCPIHHDRLQNGPNTWNVPHRHEHATKGSTARGVTWAARGRWTASGM